MGRIFTENSNWRWVDRIEPLENELAKKYFYCNYLIVPEKNGEKYEVDYLFKHPKTGETIGVEYKAPLPKNWKYKNIVVYKTAQNNDNINNQIFKYMKKMKVHWVYVHPGTNQMFIIWNQDKLKKLYTEYCNKKIPTSCADLTLFDKIINIPANDPDLTELKKNAESIERNMK